MRSCLLLFAHSDDAVLSAGQLIAGRPDTVSVTVFAGYPPSSVDLTEYDKATGFHTSRDAVSVRRQEDINAMAYLKAHPIHLDFPDSQYGEPFDHAAVVEKLGELIDKHDPEFVVSMLGLVHPDHIALREAVLDVLRGRETPLWLAEDLPSRVLYPESVPESLDALKARGLTAELGFVGTGSLSDKFTALWKYPSQMQLPEFQNRHVLGVPERFWRIRAVTPEVKS